MQNTMLLKLFSQHSYEGCYQDLDQDVMFYHLNIRHYVFLSDRGPSQCDFLKEQYVFAVF